MKKIILIILIASFSFQLSSIQLSAAENKGNLIKATGNLYVGDYLESANKRYFAIFQSD